MIDSFKGRYRFLSNFYPAIVEFGGVEYPTVEHAFQAAKTPVRSERRLIKAAATPGDAKRLGREVSLRPDWERIKLEVMEHLLRQKFEHRGLRKLLLDTGTQTLIEGNWWNDTFWGRCKGVGENHLGKLLMKIRREIRNERVRAN